MGKHPNAVLGAMAERHRVGPTPQSATVSISKRSPGPELGAQFDPARSEGAAGQGVQKRSASCTHASSHATEQQVASSLHMNSQHAASAQKGVS